jgi:hypothetical protein
VLPRLGATCTCGSRTGGCPSGCKCSARWWPVSSGWQVSFSFCCALLLCALRHTTLESEDLALILPLIRLCSQTTYLHKLGISATLTLFVSAVVLESGRISSTVAGIVLIYSLSFCEALTFLARAHADVSSCVLSFRLLEK